MGQITVDFPDEYRDDLMTGLRAFLGEDAGSLSDEAAARKAIKRFAKNEARKVQMSGHDTGRVITYILLQYQPVYIVIWACNSHRFFQRNHPS